jgi:hypothetical protein
MDTTMGMGFWFRVSAIPIPNSQAKWDPTWSLDRAYHMKDYTFVWIELDHSMFMTLPPKLCLDIVFLTHIALLGPWSS